MNDVARYSAFPLPGSMAGRQPEPLQRATGIWSTAEHDRFLDALKKFPLGPWKAITDHIGSRSIRQVQTHAQKYQEKVLRRLNGSSKAKVLRLRQEHRIDHDVLEGQSLLSTPGERRRIARNSLVAKLSGSTSAVGTSHKDLGRPAHSSNTRADGDQAEEDEDDDDNDDDDGVPTFSSDIFHVPLSELLEDDDADATRCESGGAMRDGDLYDSTDEGDDLPSLSECLDFFIMCFSAASQPPPAGLQLL